MGFVKNIAKSFVKKKARKILEKNGYPITDDVTKSIDEVADLIGNDFENGAKSGLKVVAAFVAGIPKGGPVGAFASATATAAKESEANTQKFIADVTSRGIPLTVNGHKLFNEQTNTQEYRAAELNTNLAVYGIGIIFLGVTGYLLFSKTE